MLRRVCAVLLVSALPLAGTVQAHAAGLGAATIPVNQPSPSDPDGAVPVPSTPAPEPTPEFLPSTERMTHWTCDRAAVANVAVTWLSPKSADISWRLTDRLSDGRSPLLKLVAVSYNGGEPDTRDRYFDGDGDVAATGGVGAEREGGRTWTPAVKRFDKLEVWIYNGIGGERAWCGYNIVKRLNDHVFAPERTAATVPSKSKEIRAAIVAEAWRQYRSGYADGVNKCNKYSNYFHQSTVCQAWCAVFAWYVWTKAGVPGAKAYQSSYTDDFADEWKVRFKKIGGAQLPAPGDVVVWSHDTDGINGHVGIVVQTNGWNVRVIHGNWGSAVRYENWFNPFTRTSDNGRKHVIGFASPV